MHFLRKVLLVYCFAFACTGDRPLLVCRHHSLVLRLRFTCILHILCLLVTCISNVCCLSLARPLPIRCFGFACLLLLLCWCFALLFRLFLFLFCHVFAKTTIQPNNTFKSLYQKSTNMYMQNRLKPCGKSCVLPRPCVDAGH